MPELKPGPCGRIPLQSDDAWEDLRILRSSVQQEPSLGVFPSILHQIFLGLKDWNVQFYGFPNSVPTFSLLFFLPVPMPFKLVMSLEGIKNLKMVPFCLSFSLAKGTLQLYFLLLKRGTP